MNKMAERLFSFQALKGYSTKEITKIVDGKFFMEFYDNCEVVGSIFSSIEIAHYKDFQKVTNMCEGDTLSIAWDLDINGVPFKLEEKTCKCWIVYK